MAFKRFVLKILPVQFTAKLAAFLYGAIHKFYNTFQVPTNDNGFIIRKAISLGDYIKANPEGAQLVKEFETEMVYSTPVFFPHTEINPLKHAASPVKQVACINATLIIGESNIVLTQDTYAVYDFKFQWQDSNINCTDPAVKHMKGNNLLIYLDNSGERIHEGIHLIGNFSFNYYHFLYECISKLNYINSSGIDSSVPLLVDETFLRIKQYHEILNLFNTDHRTILPIKKHKAYRVDKLYFAACPHHITPNYFNEKWIKSGDTLFDQRSLSSFLNEIQRTFSFTSYPKKIYLSRKNASARRSFNEEEVFHYLQGEGFEEVFPEQYSFAEQVTLFRNAELIVSGSGAALSNIIACTSDTCILCLVNRKHDYSYFSTLASFAGAHLIYVEGEQNTTEINIHAPFTVDIQRLKDVVKITSLKKLQTVNTNSSSIA